MVGVCVFMGHKWVGGTAGPPGGQALGQHLPPPSSGVTCLCDLIDQAFCILIS